MKKSIKELVKPRGWIFGAKWGNRPVQARVCLVTVGIAPGKWWCADLIGTERKAIEISLPGGNPDYIDNEDGIALDFLLRGVAPPPRVNFLPAFFVKDDPASEPFYHAAFSGWQLDVPKPAQNVKD